MRRRTSKRNVDLYTEGATDIYNDISQGKFYHLQNGMCFSKVSLVPTLRTQENKRDESSKPFLSSLWFQNQHLYLSPKLKPQNLINSQALLAKPLKTNHLMWYTKLLWSWMAARDKINSFLPCYTVNLLNMTIYYRASALTDSQGLGRPTSQMPV